MSRVSGAPFCCMARSKLPLYNGFKIGRTQIQNEYNNESVARSHGLHTKTRKLLKLFTNSVLISFKLIQILKLDLVFFVPEKNGESLKVLAAITTKFNPYI